MLTRAMLCLGLAALATSASAQENDAWAQLRAGMTRIEADALLGRPLLRSTGKGFELWTYSGGAEVIFYRGPVYAWTAPMPTPAAVASETTKYTHDVFFLPGRPLPSRGQPAPAPQPKDNEGYNLQELLKYRRR